MRKLLVLGTIGATVVLGAANAYAIPPSSPYAIWEPEAVEAGMASEAGQTTMNEARAAFVQDGAVGSRGPSWKDSTYYSRGK